MRSSLTFQILLNLGPYLVGIFAVTEAALILYKSIVFPFPTVNIVSEIFLLSSLIICESLRHFFSWKGNLTESSGNLIFALILLIPGILGVVFFLVWQTYVLRIEVVLCGITLSMQILQAVFSFVGLISFCGKAPS